MIIQKILIYLQIPAHWWSQITNKLFDFDSAVFPNAYGIDASPNGEWLILVNIAFHRLYKSNPSTGEAIKIDLRGVDVPNGNGLV